jgi:hypothetical protein
MKKYACLSLILLALLCASCTVAVDGHSLFHHKDLEITVDDGCEEIELVTIGHSDSPFGKNFHLSIPFFSVNVTEDGWTGEKCVDVDIFQ